jgi:hypothetical protein
MLTVLTVLTMYLVLLVLRTLPDLDACLVVRVGRIQIRMLIAYKNEHIDSTCPVPS